MGLISYENEAINEVKKADNHHVSKFVTSYYGPSSSSWQSGRWILFVLFVAAIILIILFTFVANRRRRRMGRAPIRGTAWLTPPSYRQSQQQYTGTVQQWTDDYVPEYTETANEHDLDTMTSGASFTSTIRLHTWPRHWYKNVHQNLLIL